MSQTINPYPRQVVPSPRGPRGWWRRRSRRTRRVLVSLVLLSVGGLVAMAAVVYVLVKAPLPDRLPVAQTTTLTYRNGAALGTIGTVNRTNVPLTQVPVPVRQAVLAAEDHNYYSEPGISIRGIGRALWTDIRGGEVSQGGSTITQQYAKNAYLTSQRTLSRKLKEIVVAIKLDHKYSKDQILESYLNTIYFGRGAYGIQAASQTYFGVNSNQLTVSQGAVLAGLIRAPSVLDPRVSPNSSKTRWHEVIDAMVQQKWLTQAAADTLTIPTTLPVGAANHGNPITGFIEDQVKKELVADGVSEDLINRGGLHITTTLDQKLEFDAIAAVNQVTAGAPAALQEGLVAVQPGTGRVRAYYPGSGTGSKGRRYVDNATRDPVPVGSSFKPIVLATALSEGISLDKVYDGSSPQSFPGVNQGVVTNFGNEQPGYVNLIRATAMSVNTVYVHLGQDAGIDKVADQAEKLGLPAIGATDRVASLPLGFLRESPYNMAAVYGAFAGGGTTAPSHLVSLVTDPSGHVVYKEKDRRSQAISKDVDADATYAMQAVFTDPAGTAAGDPLANGRAAAGKTGTASDNPSAWFCGFTPQLAAVVDVFRDDYKPLVNTLGYSEVTGATLPLKIWNTFMNSALQDAPNEAFPPRAYVGSQAPVVTPAPTAAPTIAPTTAAPTTAAPTTTAPTSAPTSAPATPSVPSLPTGTPPTKEPTGTPATPRVSQSPHARPS
jgi:membrane peptidoglycan carboxypeptidase